MDGDNIETRSAVAMFDDEEELEEKSIVNWKDNDWSDLWKMCHNHQHSWCLTLHIYLLSCRVVVVCDTLVLLWRLSSFNLKTRHLSHSLSGADGSVNEEAD